MCGIAGFIDYRKVLNKDNLVLQTNSLIHRGPDGAGFYFDNQDSFNIGLGHRRLSIIDLNNTGDQPMKFNDLIIVFNGEIYNYKEIKKNLESLGHKFSSSSDTEVILHAFSQWGVDCINRFIGMFAFCIYDKTNKEFYIFRDRAGVKPLYYFLSEKTLVFGSELKAVENLNGVSKEINHNSLREFLQFGYITAPNTIFKSIRKLEPGSYIRIALGKQMSWENIKYWNHFDYYNQPKNESISYKDAKEQLRELLIDACQLRMVADVPVGVFLSGGYDSSLVASLLTKESNFKLKTFSIGFDDKNYNEAEYAKSVSLHLNTDHSELICTKSDAQNIIPELPYYFDEPFGDSSAIPTILVSKLASKEVKVSLSADGGDELFGGYNKYTNALKFNELSNKIPKVLREPISKMIELFPIALAEKIRGKKTDRLMILKLAESIKLNSNALQSSILINSSVFNENQLRHIISDFEKIDSGDNKLLGYYNASTNFSKLNSMLAYDYITYMIDDILTKVDRATMSVSIEGREPLLDHRILEFVSSLPDTYKVNNVLGKKRILKDIVHDYIPESLMNRPKMGFGVPVFSWMKSDLRSLFNDTISKSNLEKFGLNSKSILELKHNYFKGDTSSFNLLWYIFCYIEWAKKWI